MQGMQHLIDTLNALQRQAKDASKFLDLPKLESRVQTLEEEMQHPDFWNDSQKAQTVSQEHGALKSRVESWKKLTDDIAYDLELTGVISQTADDEEYQELEKSVAELEKRYAGMEEQLYLSGKYDLKNAILSIHAGAGGTDAQDWAEMLLRMYTRYAEAKGWKATFLEKSDGDEAGIKSATLKIEGEYIYGFLKEEAGVHRLVRLSPFNSKNTRETSFCMVDVIPDIDHQEVQINEDDLKIDVYRSSGKGGQSVNTTDSAVRITHLPTGIVVQCQNERSQLQNKQQAMQTLSAKLVALQERLQLKELSDIRGDHVENSWGNQIRSYVLHPYQMVKDHRTNHETSQVDAVLDGDPNQLDVFIEKSLKAEGSRS